MTAGVSADADRPFHMVANTRHCERSEHRNRRASALKRRRVA
jgi:hypothetical protein